MVDLLAGNMYSFLNNFKGTPIILTDQDGMVVWEADYKPYGEALVNSNSEVVNNFRFAGQYFDQETGLHYNYFRYYDPQTGRYLRPDPIGLAGGNNLFVYTNANPINFIDPLGLETLYDRIHPSFLEDIRKDNPVEHYLFTQYTKRINTDLWTDDIRWLELSWTNFDPYAKQRAGEMIAEGCEETWKSIYGPVGILGKYLEGFAGLLLGIYGDVGTTSSAISLIEISREASNIWINGPAVVNENTWIEAFGRPYTPGLR
jgi:RHS repeat-associated protein